MKKIVLSATLACTTLVFSQKKEVVSAFKALESGDVATAKNHLKSAEDIMQEKTYLLDPSVLEQYYYTKGITLLRSGKTSEGATFLAKISELGKDKFYEGKDGKTRVYFFGKKAAEASGIQGLKESSHKPSLTEKIIVEVNPKIQVANKAAIDAYNAKDYNLAGPKFREVYDFLKAAGQENKQILYYSAVSYAMSDDKNKAMETYSDLINSGYNGVSTKYIAKNKKSGQVEELDKSSWELLKKTGGGDYTDFKTETTPNIEQELYETTIALMLDANKNNEAVALASKAMKKFPNNSKFGELQGTAYYRAGKTEEFIASLKDLVARNPQDKISWYNLGVLASKDPKKYDEAIGYFKKATEIDSQYVDAYKNLAYLIMDIDNDGKYVEQYETLRKSGKPDEANKIMEARRTRFKNALPYAEKWYAIAPNDLDVVALLKGLYQSTRNEVKYKEFKAKEETLSKQSK